MNICQSCGITFKPQRNSKGLYCSRSCSAKVNGSKYPKRQLTLMCGWNNCTTLIPRSQRRCSEHKGLRHSGPKTHGLYTENAWFMTLGELRSALFSPNSDDFAKFLRTHARRWAASKLPHQYCVVCNYDKVTVLAHVKPLSSFSDESTLESTFKNNLVRLCPNCHWEFDNGLLESLPGVEPGS